PFVPGARPSNASDDNIFVCASSASTSIGGSWPIGVCPVAGGGAPAAGFGLLQDTAPMPPEPEQAAAVRHKKAMQRDARAYRAAFAPLALRRASPKLVRASHERRREPF